MYVLVHFFYKFQGCYDTIWTKSFGKTAIAVPVLIICGLIQVGSFEGDMIQIICNVKINQNQEVLLTKHSGSVI